MTPFRILGIATMLCAPLFGFAESLQGVGALDTLGDVKAKFPNANISPVKAAWVTKNDGFFSLKGEGFPGTLYLAFSDSRPFWRDMLASQKSNAQLSKLDEAKPTNFEEMANESDDEALSIKWVRWVPSAPIPLERYKGKYGPPTKCDFRDEDMRPYCSWDSKGLDVTLSDDQKMVLNVEATYTISEQRAAWKSKRGYIPEWLQKISEIQSSSAPSKPVSSPAMKKQK